MPKCIQYMICHIKQLTTSTVSLNIVFRAIHIEGDFGIHVHVITMILMHS